MRKSPFLFVFAISLMLIVIVTISPWYNKSYDNSWYHNNNNAYAQTIELSVNQRIFSPGDTLVTFGKGIPNDNLIAELYNPAGRLILRVQIDVGVEGSFSKIMLKWPQPDTDKFRFGTYTLIVTSSKNPESNASDALIFQPIVNLQQGVERKLDVQLSIPSVIGRNESATLIAQVTMNGVLVKGDPAETLKNSFTRFPDGTLKTINNFTALEDGIYVTKFSSPMLGQHTVHVQAYHQGLVASGVAGVYVTNGPILSVGSEIDRLNSNVESLRQETVGKTAEISRAVQDIGSEVQKISSAAGQVTSLLLPIIGMIAIIVALQATILAKRK